MVSCAHILRRSAFALLLFAAPTVAAAEESYTWLLTSIDNGSHSGTPSNEHTTWPTANVAEGRWSQQLGRVTPVRPHGLTFGDADGIPVTGDFNGDGYDEIGLFRDGLWLIDFNGNSTWDHQDLVVRLGTRGDRPVTGDWNQDGKTDIGVVGLRPTIDAAELSAEAGLPHPLNNRAGRKNGGRGYNFADCTVQYGADSQPVVRDVDHVFQFGYAGDEPVIGDWTGSGVPTIGTFRDGRWLLDIDGDGRFTQADRSVDLGNAGDLPVVGDFNGDGIDELGVYRHGNWMLDGAAESLALGSRSDRPVVGDWDGDGVDQIGVFHQ